jgi:hypothetical protein
LEQTNTKDIKVFSSYGYYFGKIYVSPTDENKVITFGTGIILSTDGGKLLRELIKIIHTATGIVAGSIH